MATKPAWPPVRLPDGTTRQYYELEYDTAQVPNQAYIKNFTLSSGWVRWDVVTFGMGAQRTERWECHFRTAMLVDGVITPNYDREPQWFEMTDEVLG